MNFSFYWHDYETWGADPVRDRPAQFAGQRTDADLHPIDDPLVLFARPADDLLPHPEACLITGITPQRALAEGLPEAEFIARVRAPFMVPGTCGAGYNNIRFDDEITRHTLYRNCFDPYEREWRNGNSRWDLIDVMRMAHALRPEGIQWPRHEDGTPSFRLEDLAEANAIAHQGAHDALADVNATIDLARLLKRVQPRLFTYALALRHKDRVAELLDLRRPRPLLHVSSRYPAETGCIAPVLPLAAHPVNRNGVIVWDLRRDPRELLDLAPEAVRERLFVSREDLPEGVERLPLKVVHLNRSPMLAPLNTLSAERAGLWAIDLTAVHRHAARLAHARGLAAKLQEVFARPADGSERDPDFALYDGFLGDADRALCDQARALPPERLATWHPDFADPRLPEILFRYRARNWPETLNPEERERWQAFRWRRLTDPQGGGSITLDAYGEALFRLRERFREDPRAQAVLDDLEAWAEGLMASA